MKPFLAIFSVALTVAYLHIAPGTAYSDRAALGARLIRGLKTRTHTKKPTTNEGHAGGEQDTVSKDMEKQMKRIDALEDIFIGSSGSRGGSSINSARRSSVDAETKDLDKDLSELNDDDDAGTTVLEKRNEYGSYDGGDVGSPKGFGYEESTVEKANSRRRREVAAAGKAGEGSSRDAKNASKGKEDESRDSLLEKELSDDDGTGFSDKTDSASTSKKSEIPGAELAKSVVAVKDEDSGADLMGGTGAIAGDLEPDDSDDKGQDNGNHGDEGNGDDGDVDDRISENGNGDSEKGEDDGKPEEDDKKYENEDDDKKSEIVDDGKSENDDDGKSENDAVKNSEIGVDNSENDPFKNSEIDADKNSENDADKNSENDAVKNSENGAVKNSEIGADKDSEIGAVKNSENDADKNSQNDADKNSEIGADKDSEIGADKDSENDAVKNSEIGADKYSEIGADKDSEIGADKDSEIGAVKNSENDADKNSEIDAVKNSENDGDKNSEIDAEEAEESENDDKSDDAVDNDGDFEKTGERKSKIDGSEKENEEFKNSPKPDVDDEGKDGSKIISKFDDAEDVGKSDSEDKKSNYVDNKSYGDESREVEERVHAIANGDDDDDSEKDGENKKFVDDVAPAEEDKGDAESDSADKQVSCRTTCSPPMDYETCAVPRCDYKVGTIKDLCQYLCRHQKERCQEVCD